MIRINWDQIIQQLLHKGEYFDPAKKNLLDQTLQNIEKIRELENELNGNLSKLSKYQLLLKHERISESAFLNILGEIEENIDNLYNKIDPLIVQVLEMID